MNNRVNIDSLPENQYEVPIDFEDLERQLEEDLQEQFSDLAILEEDRRLISSPESLSSVMMNVVWEQFINQVGVIAGEDFIKENRGLKLDLSDDAHIQSTENFAKGKIATHNDKIDYQQRYEEWQANFMCDESGNIVTHPTRTGKEEATLVKGARAPFDQGRRVGSAERGTDMDHTISAGEIIRDPEANAHLTKEEQVRFANSEANLSEMDANQNRSKGDLSMTDWLDNPNKRGQKPSEIFDISKEQDRQYREKDKKARREYKKVKEEGVERSIATGRQSQIEEGFRITGKALRSVIMGLIAELIKKIARKLICWLRSAEKNLNTFISHVKAAIMDFIHNLKYNLLTAGNTLITTIATAIIGPVVSIIKKAWIFLKQGYKSLKEAINYVNDVKNRNKPFSIMVLEVGKIVVAGITAGGALLLGEVIEKALMTIPAFAIQIPLLGCLANILGILFGAVISGIVGSLALTLIDKVIAKRQLILNDGQQFETRNKIIAKQEELIAVSGINMQMRKSDMMLSVNYRHSQAASIIKDSVSFIMSDSVDIDGQAIDNNLKLNNLLDEIKNHI